MSKKTTTTSTQQNQYNPLSMATYEKFLQQIGGWAQQYQGNPLESQYFQLMNAAGQKQANAFGRRGMSNIQANMSNLPLSPAALQSLIAKAGRHTSGLQSNAFMSAGQGAFDMQRAVMQQLQQFSPLQTGMKQNQVQQTSGLGTWLPMVAQMAFGAAMPWMKGKFSGAFAEMGAANGSAGPSNLPTGFGNIPGGNAPPGMWGQLPSGIAGAGGGILPSLGNTGSWGLPSPPG